MINFNFFIVNPFRDHFKIERCFHGTLTKYKSWEANSYRTSNIVALALSYTTKGDHAGLQIEFGLLGYNFEFCIHDIRHWDYEKNQWESHD